ncbi:hypothetical protein JQX13_03545 [Archangium violaceum]|uniref:WD40/YVTN/BNR-like repeat-containing protein n=1 Tax=Archangium violaceum TaxID=83451 RepID=UPI00193B93E3|nr:hypothetical protein [Archangium violaceum]QRK09243.1 hypothetical protein JQX13_03545 [Archangium violaceum]
MVNSVWKPLGHRRDRDLPDKLFIGERSAFYTTSHFDEERTTLWRISPDRLRPWSSVEGKLLTMTSADGTWFGILSQPTPDRSDTRTYKLIRSRDEGRSWEERGVVPGTSSLLVVSEQEVWGLGSGTLYVSTDAGQTLTPVSLPGTRNGITEQLARGVDGTIWLLGPSGLFRISDQGRHWTHDPMQGAELQAGSGGFLVGRVGGALSLRRDVPGTQWVPITDQAHNVHELAVSGDLVRVITHARDPFKSGGDVWYHHSEDGGLTWKHVDTGLHLRIAIGGREWGAGTDILGQLYGHVPEDEK